MSSILRGILMGAAAIVSAAAAEHEYEFRQRLDASEYEQRVAKLPAEQLDPERVKTSKLPLWGVRVMAVDAGTQAEAQGLGVGWTIERVNGKDYWNHKQGMAGARPDQPQAIAAVSPEGERREFVFKPGRIGIRTENAHQTGAYLMRHLPEGAWAPELLVADLSWREGGHELAETALHRAVEKGMPVNRFSRYFGAQLAADAGKEQLSRQMLEALVEEVSEEGEIPRYFRPGVRTLALAHGKLDLLKDNLQELAGFRDELQPQSVLLWESWLGETGWPESILSEVRGKARENLLPHVVGVEDGWGKLFQQKDPEPLRDGSHTTLTRPPEYEHFVFRPGEPLRDAFFEVRGVFGENGNPQPFHEITLQLIDLGKRAEAAKAGVWNQGLWTVAGIRVRRETGYGQVCYLSGGPVPNEVPTQRYFPRATDGQVAQMRKAMGEGKMPQLTEQTKFKVTLIKSGGVAEVAVNDVSYLRVPVAPGVGDLGCVIHSTGMVVALEEITLRPVEQP